MRFIMENFVDIDLRKEILKRSLFDAISLLSNSYDNTYYILSHGNVKMVRYFIDELRDVNVIFKFNELEYENI